MRPGQPQALGNTTIQYFFYSAAAILITQIAFESTNTPDTFGAVKMHIRSVSVLVAGHAKT